MEHAGHLRVQRGTSTMQFGMNRLHRRRKVAVKASVTPVTTTLRQPVAKDLEGRPLPLNTYGGKKPSFTGKVISIHDMGGRDKERHVSHIVIDTGGVEFVEGQAFGVAPPGTKLNSRGQEVPQHVRLYSIASSRYGDSGDTNTCTLCVVRVIYHDQDGKEVRGVCSNYLCDRKPGDELVMSGPAGTAMLLPPDVWARPVVCVSTGTGIAPFRSYWRRLFYDAVPGTEGYQSRFWLLAGFANEDSVLYGDELDAIVATYPDNARVDVVLSQKQQSRNGGPKYVQDAIEESAEEFLSLMTGDEALFYFCGLKRMYTSVMEVLERIGQERGIDTAALIKQLKSQHRWHVETA